MSGASSFKQVASLSAREKVNREISKIYDGTRKKKTGTRKTHLESETRDAESGEKRGEGGGKQTGTGRSLSWVKLWTNTHRWERERTWVLCNCCTAAAAAAVAARARSNYPCALCVYWFQQEQRQWHKWRYERDCSDVDSSSAIALRSTSWRSK